MIQLRFRTWRPENHHRRSSFRLTAEGHLITVSPSTPKSSTSQPNSSNTNTNSGAGAEIEIEDANLVQKLGEYATPLPVPTSQTIHLALNRLYPINFIRRVQETHPRQHRTCPVFQDEEETDTDMDMEDRKSDTDTVDTSSFSCASLRWFLRTRNNAPTGLEI